MKVKGRKPRAIDLEHWGLRLSQVLKERGLSNRAAAKLIGASPSLFDSWIRNGASPSDLKLVRKLAEKLSVDFCWLLTGERQSALKIPALTEIFKETRYLDCIARIRIDRLDPVNGDKDDESESA